MAAVLTPNRSEAAPRCRPELRLVQGGPSAMRPLGGLDISRSGVIAALIGLLLVVVAVLALGQGALAGLAPEPVAASPVAAAGPATAVATADAVVVRSGDTLWAIARRLQPEGDVRPLVDRLAELNGGAALTPGDRLLIP